MKIRQNIQKKQGGGIIYTPFIPSYQDYATSDNNSKTNSDAGKLGDLQKEILDVLQENGLPSDVGTFLSTAQNFLRRAEMTGDWSMNDFIRVQSMANRVAHNKGLFDAATKQLTEKGNWNEVAIDNRGYIYAMDKEGKVTKLNPLEYYQKRDQYQAMTNNDLLEYRSDYNPFNSSMINDASGAATVNDIVEYAKNIVMDFGTTSVSGYTNSELTQMDQALNTLLYGGPTGYYKFKKEMQIDDSGAAMAINYLISALPANMRQLLMAKTAAENQDPNVHSVDLLVNILGHHVDRSIDVSFDSAATKSAGIGADSESQKQVERTLAERYVDGNGLGQHQWIEIRPWDSNASLMVMGQSAQTIMDKDLKTPLPTSTLTQVFTQGYGIGGVTRKDSVSFGDQLLNPGDYDKVVYDSSTPLYRVIMPYKTVSGRIVPDLELVEIANTLQKDLEEQGITDPGYISELVNEYFQGKATYNAQDGTIEFKQQMPFLTFGAIVGGKTVSFNKDSKFVYNLDRNEGAFVKDIYNNTVQFGNQFGTGEEIGDYKNARKGNLYIGNIFIPIDNSLAGASIFNNDTAPASRYQDMTATAEANAYTRAVQQSSQPRTNF